MHGAGLLPLLLRREAKLANYARYSWSLGTQQFKILEA